MTNLLFTTFLYANSIGLSETKIDYGARLEYQLKPKYSIGIQVNNHANDSAIDGMDIYVTRNLVRLGQWSPSLYIGIGSNIEDSRIRNSVGICHGFRFRKHLLAQASIAYQREYGEWKGDRRPNAMITIVGMGWEF